MSSKVALGILPGDACTNMVGGNPYHRLARSSGKRLFQDAAIHKLKYIIQQNPEADEWKHHYVECQSIQHALADTLHEKQATIDRLQTDLSSAQFKTQQAKDHATTQIVLMQDSFRKERMASDAHWKMMLLDMQKRAEKAEAELAQLRYGSSSSTPSQMSGHSPVSLVT